MTNEQPKKNFTNYSVKETEVQDRANLLLWTRKKTNNPTLEDTGDFAYVLDQLEDIIQRTGIASESLADMSQTFDGSTHKQMMGLLSPYRRVKFL